ncbi:MAG: endonuclease/exonuclease/phosphatase family protein [Alistipes sp.]|nr:endonuclease/exonuclease/phosphatase family protein [Alistipes senegalensis]MCM1249676.1 endonuclease/exonuclease/phosphatase family protein [Alistipes sp.]
MEEEKYIEYKGGSQRPHRSVWMWFVDGALTLLTAIMGIAMPMIYLVPYVDPARMWIFPVLATAVPALYVLTVLLACYWIVRWRLLRAGWMVVLVAAGLFGVSLFWKPQLGRTYGEGVSERGTFRLMSYNVRSFRDAEGASSVDRIAELIDSLKPDVICFQEFNARLAGQSERFAELRKRYESARFELAEDAEPQQAILSRHRIVRSGVLLTPESSVWADVAIGDDTVRFYNHHLRSTAIKAADNDYIVHRGFIGDTAREVKFRSMAGRLRRNGVLRAEQVDSIVRAMDPAPELRIVCGDFNDTPLSYVYRTMSRGLKDAFSECGSGYSHTYRGFFDMLRIDYVLGASGLQAVSYEVPAIECSDHYPVVARFKSLTGRN